MQHWHRAECRASTLPRIHGSALQVESDGYFQKIAFAIPFDRRTLDAKHLCSLGPVSAVNDPAFVGQDGLSDPMLGHVFDQRVELCR